MQMSCHNLASSHNIFFGLGFWSFRKCFQGSNSGPHKVLNPKMRNILETLINAGFDRLSPFAVDLEKLEFNHS